MNRIKNIRPGVLVIADAELRLEPGQVVEAERLTKADPGGVSRRLAWPWPTSRERNRSPSQADQRGTGGPQQAHRHRRHLQGQRGGQSGDPQGLHGNRETPHGDRRAQEPSGGSCKVLLSDLIADLRLDLSDPQGASVHRGPVSGEMRPEGRLSCRRVTSTNR